MTIENLSDLIFKFFTERRYRIWRHSLLIGLLIASTWKSTLPEPANMLVHLVLAALILFVFYFNMYYLVPRYLFRDRFQDYLLHLTMLVTTIVLLLAMLKYVWSCELSEPQRREMQDMNIFSVFFVVIMLFASSSTIKLFQKLIVDSRRINELESMTALAELEQLKNQITPHFLFNMLNNANVLTLRDPEKASLILIKLGDLLRYQLYDSTMSAVLLTADIRFLEDLLALEKIRRDNFQSIVSKNGDLNGIYIAPLLFVVFVENALKHNLDSERPSFVHLYFSVQDRQLHFKCINSKPPSAGIGPGANFHGPNSIERRLELLYPGKHQLKVIDDLDSFTVYLVIDLSADRN